MNRIAALLCISLACLCSCGSGGGIDPPTDSTINVVLGSAGSARVAAPSDSADAGTTVSLAAPATGSSTVREDGSFFFAGTIGDAASVTVNYTKQGDPFSTAVTPISLASRVDKQFAAAGAGPNDLALSGASLFVANSLDNSVMRFDLSGALQATATFPQFSSPSYLAAADGFLYVVRNGDNILTRLDAASLLPSLPARDVEIAPGSTAIFLGPGPLAVDGSLVYCAFAGITDFGPPSVYGATGGARVNMDSGALAGSLDLQGFEDAQEAQLSADGERLYVITAGSLQFDENFSPFVTSDSHLHVFDTAALPGAASPLASINLGEIGASRIAVSPADANVAYITSLLNGNLYKVDIAELEVLRGENNPLVLTSEFTYLSDIEFTPDGELLLAASFNTDELFVLNPDNDLPSPGLYASSFDLSLDPQLLAGCQSLAVGVNPDRPGTYRAYVLYAIANGIATVDLF